MEYGILSVPLKLDLNKASAEEVFAYVVNGLVKQGWKRSVLPISSGKEERCRYHIQQENGTTIHCAAGQLIDWDKIDLGQFLASDMNGGSWRGLRDFASDIPADHEILIVELQTVHDVQGPEATPEQTAAAFWGYGRAKNFFVGALQNFIKHGMRY